MIARTTIGNTQKLLISVAVVLLHLLTAWLLLWQMPPVLPRVAPMVVEFIAVPTAATPEPAPKLEKPPIKKILPSTEQKADQPPAKSLPTEKAPAKKSVLDTPEPIPESKPETPDQQPSTEQNLITNITTTIKAIKPPESAPVPPDPLSHLEQSADQALQALAPPNHAAANAAKATAEIAETATEKIAPPRQKLAKQPSAITDTNKTHAADLPAASLAPVAPTKPTASPALPSAWQAQVRTIVEQGLIYPPQALAKKWRGRTIVRVSVDSGGRVIDALISSSSGKTVLDKEAIACIRRVSLPPPPKELLTGNHLSFTIPVKFDQRTNPAS